MRKYFGKGINVQLIKWNFVVQIGEIASL